MRNKGQNSSVREIAKLHRDGLSLREIEAKTGIPRTTVCRELRRLAGARPVRRLAPVPASPTPAAACELPAESPPMSADDQRVLLSTLLRSVTDSANAARAACNEALAGSCTRQATAISAALRRLNPPEQDDPTVVHVKAADMEQAAARARHKLQDMLERVTAERETWPKCPSCGQPVKPEGQP